MQLLSNSFAHNQAIPAEFAFCKLGSGDAPVDMSSNRSPHLAWRDAPAGTRSFVLACIDIDVPSRGDDVNQPGRTVPADLPRVEFAHWLMANIPSDCTELAAGSCSDGITARGKQSPAGPSGSLQGRNDYTGWFASDPDMSGTYLGYDGPCPPFNDALLHRYCFRIYALDVEQLALPQAYDWAQLQAAMQGHVLAQAELIGTYTLNRDLA